MSGWHGAYVHRARAYLAPMLPTACARCGGLVTEDMRWDVGHVIGKDIAPELMHDPSNWRIEHSYCNRAAGAAYGNRKRGWRRKQRSAPTSRRW